MRKDADLAHWLAVTAVRKDDLHVSIAPLFAPLPKREHDGQQILPLGGQRVDDAAAVIAIGPTLKYSAGNKLGEAIGQDVAGNSEARLELFEVLQSIERSAKNEESP